MAESLLNMAKAVCRVTSEAFDLEIKMLLDAAKEDMGLADISQEALDSQPALIQRAIMTYVSMNFKLSNGQIDALTYQRLKESYDEQKRQMGMSSQYGDWGGYKCSLES